jgi:hypothetical protein
MKSEKGRKEEKNIVVMASRRRAMKELGRVTKVCQWSFWSLKTAYISFEGYHIFASAAHRLSG